MKQILKDLLVSNLILSQLDRSVIKQDAKRLFHGRGKKFEGLEHLSIDLFNETILITAYKEISDEDKIALKEMLFGLSGLNLKNILLQKRYLRNEEIEVIHGEIPLVEYAQEKDLKFLIKLARPQNIGFFLDMKIGRDWLKINSNNKKVLNLFSYTCSLSVAALIGGANEVVNVDMSKASLDTGRTNHKLNGLEKKSVKYLAHDIMKSLGNISNKGPYDLVIIDPPSNQGSSFKVERDYAKILKRLEAMTCPGAYVLACLNAPHINSSYIKDLMAEFAPVFTFQDIMYSSFSSMDSNPEEGLKILLYKRA